MVYVVAVVMVIVPVIVLWRVGINSGPGDQGFKDPGIQGPTETQLFMEFYTLFNIIL